MAKSFSEVPPPSEEELARRAEKAKRYALPNWRVGVTVDGLIRNIAAAARQAIQGTAHCFPGKTCPRLLVIDEVRRDAEACLADGRGPCHGASSDLQFRLVRVEEPAIEHDAAGKPAVGYQSSGEKVAQKFRQRPVRRRGFAETLAQPGRIGHQSLAAIVLSGFEDRGGGHQPGLDRRPDALAALRIGQAGGIADQQYAVIEQPALGASIHQVGMPVEFFRGVAGDPAAPADEIEKMPELPV